MSNIDKDVGTVAIGASDGSGDERGNPNKRVLGVEKRTTAITCSAGNASDETLDQGNRL